MGTRGDRGDERNKGEHGEQGNWWTRGTGGKGEQGKRGGIRGDMGNKGNKGEQWEQGGTGVTRGTRWNMGNRRTGERGEQGEEGNWGGIRGDRGDKGNKGEQRQEGNMGIYWPLRKRVARLPNSTKKRKTSVDRLLQTTHGDKHFKSFTNVRERVEALQWGLVAELTQQSANRPLQLSVLWFHFAVCQGKLAGTEAAAGQAHLQGCTESDPCNINNTLIRKITDTSLRWATP